MHLSISQGFPVTSFEEVLYGFFVDMFCFWRGVSYMVCLVVRRDYQKIKKLNCRHDHIALEFHC